MINYLKEKAIFRWIFWTLVWLLGYILIYASIVVIGNSRSSRKVPLDEILEGIQKYPDMFIDSMLVGFGLYLGLSILIFAIVLIFKKLNTTRKLKQSKN